MIVLYCLIYGHMKQPTPWIRIHVEVLIVSAQNALPLWNPRVQFHVYKSQPLDRILG
jgi:hypothetical protein